MSEKTEKTHIALVYIPIPNFGSNIKQIKANHILFPLKS